MKEKLDLDPDLQAQNGEKLKQFDDILRLIKLAEDTVKQTGFFVVDEYKWEIDPQVVQAMKGGAFSIYMDLVRLGLKREADEIKAKYVPPN